MQNTPSQTKNGTIGECVCSSCGQKVKCDLVTDLYEALKALVDHFRANDENYYKSDLCTDAISALAKVDNPSAL